MASDEDDMGPRSDEELVRAVFVWYSGVTIEVDRRLMDLDCLEIFIVELLEK